MHNIHDPGEYHKYKSVSGESNNYSGGGGSGCARWIVVAIVTFFLISFIIDGASWEAIETLLSFGLIAYFIAKKMFE